MIFLTEDTKRSGRKIGGRTQRSGKVAVGLKILVNHRRQGKWHSLCLGNKIPVPSGKQAMTDTILTISSKNYSSWSLRGWLLCKMAGLEFAEEVVPVFSCTIRHVGGPLWIIHAAERVLTNVWLADRLGVRDSDRKRS